MRNALAVVFGFMLLSCSQEPLSVTAEDYHLALDQTTEIMIHDIFSPPVASRIYAYPTIAAYEIMTQKDSTYTSLSGQLNDFDGIPQATTGVNQKVAAWIAYTELSKKLVFSEHMMESFQETYFKRWKKANKREFENSMDYASKVVQSMLAWMKNDMYNQTRTMPKFTIDTENPSRWQPTPPAYMDGIEPHWNKIRPFTLTSADQFKPETHPEFSLDIDSAFYKELLEVYTISKELEEEGDESEGIKIAQFWDCNPYVSVQRGHLMFATKKITPGAHWMGITKIAARTSEADYMKTAAAYALTAISLADGFISCWDEKYRSNLIRPETLINQHIDDSWQPILQTPPFPEYTSGHSVVSGAASTALTTLFGDDFAFTDDTEVPYGLPIRSYTSFNQAAAEAAISRMYGGIHYRSAVDIGLAQGKSIGQWVTQNVKMK